MKIERRIRMGKKLTKVGNGIKRGDVANTAIRNILTSISESMDTRITEDGIYESLEFFDWKCPYTGRYLGNDLKNNVNAVLDHIVPQNKNACGLNVKGNLVFVIKEANAAKSSKDVEEFLMTNNTVDGLKDASTETRQARLRKIKEFQMINHYDPEKIKAELSDYLLKCYSEVQEKQVKNATEAIEKLKSVIPQAFREKTQNHSFNKIDSIESQEKPAVIVKEQLIPLLESGQASPDEIDALQTIEISKKEFGLSGFPLLAEALNAELHIRFYKDPIVIRGKQYYLCSQWYTKNIPYLLNWIQKHKIY